MREMSIHNEVEATRNPMSAPSLYSSHTLARSISATSYHSSVWACPPSDEMEVRSAARPRSLWGLQ